jgi:hypothetical protein
MTQRYIITNGPDGITWVSLQPLLADINEQLDKPEIAENQLVVDSLFAVKSFVIALIEEGRVQEYPDGRDDELAYRDTL